MSGQELLRIEEVRLSRGSREVLRGVSFAVQRGEIVALMGLSGGGKTTVLRAIAALEPFDTGTIDVGGVVLRAGDHPPRAAIRQLRRRVGLVFQAPSLFEHLTAIENVMLAPLNVAHADRSQATVRAIELLDSLGVAHRRNAFPRELSGGEAQRVAIARAMAMEPPLLMMDEPTAALDPARRFELGETLVRLTREGRTLLVTTHDDDFARDFATRVIILAEGEIVEEGNPREVLTNPKHPATKALLQGTTSPES
jgi:ABC-type polar amino acid transport system ATPase subunit